MSTKIIFLGQQKKINF